MNHYSWETAKRSVKPYLSVLLLQVQAAILFLGSLPLSVEALRKITEPLSTDLMEIFESILAS